MGRIRSNNFKMEAKRTANQCFAVRVTDSSNLARLPWLDTDIDDQAKLIEWAGHWSELEGLAFLHETPSGAPTLVLNRVTVSNYQREIRVIQQAIQADPSMPNRKELEQRIVMLNSRLIAGDKVEEQKIVTPVDTEKRARLIYEWSQSGSSLSINEWIAQKEASEKETSVVSAVDVPITAVDDAVEREMEKL